ncbi:hypothetical protein JQ607_06770 [Bradyrhizobium liaoningense]|uniref:hypothetical protein n=1 Tax=Bradyrhizobium liaoningense TaxID=43992 RepID=UPI001BAD22F4|nr:hypothetical protein [Bradyrhizobium liaoningense]MBR0839894.1 hypothetical protein [Bradyrhizobium liaoningense]MBR0854034.1 hypothetical protein [Bradyrhizobium liaoningense]
MVLSSIPALADSCAEHYQMSGVPLVTGTTHKVWMMFPSVNPGVALDKVSRAVLAEGFVGVNVDKNLGTLTTQQETTGSGRPQTLRVVVRKEGRGSRVDAVFILPPGQVAPGVSDNLCRVVDAAGR